MLDVCPPFVFCTHLFLAHFTHTHTHMRPNRTRTFMRRRVFICAYERGQHNMKLHNIPSTDGTLTHGALTLVSVTLPFGFDFIFDASANHATAASSDRQSCTAAATIFANLINIDFFTQGTLMIAYYLPSRLRPLPWPTDLFHFDGPLSTVFVSLLNTQLPDICPAHISFFQFPNNEINEFSVAHACVLPLMLCCVRFFSSLLLFWSSSFTNSFSAHERCRLMV